MAELATKRAPQQNTVSQWENESECGESSSLTAEDRSAAPVPTTTCTAEHVQNLQPSIVVIEVNFSC